MIARNRKEGSKFFPIKIKYVQHVRIVNFSVKCLEFKKKHVDENFNFASDDTEKYLHRARVYKVINMLL